MMELHSEYRTDDVSPPGDTLLETLESLGMTQAELAKRMGRPRKTINEIVKGKTAITPETALQLELVLQISASFWNERERRYREAMARVEQHQKLAGWTDWLDNVPYRDLVRFGWIKDFTNPVEKLREILLFFGVVSPAQWEKLWKEKIGVAFRKSNAYSADEMSVAAWLRKAELEAHNIECAPYDESKFRQVLRKVRSLTGETPNSSLFQKELIELCRHAGVAVTIIPRLPKSRAFGAGQWLSSQKAHIALSLYYKTDDQFWFSFFHEAAHILLHSKKEVFIDEGDSNDTEMEDGDDETNDALQGTMRVFIDNADRNNIDVEETEADEFARDWLISPAQLDLFVQTRSRTSQGDLYFGKDEVCMFAKEIDIAPGIVVGRLQHDALLDRKFNNDLKTVLGWDEHWQLIVKKVRRTP